jgi:hypothetical protein
MWKGLCALLLIPVLGSLASESTLEIGPQRVKISAFSISLTPASRLSLYQAKRVRDIAESILKEKLKEHDFGSYTTYDYAGLQTADSVSQTADSTIIVIQGGVVVFTSNSTQVPSFDEIEFILREDWMSDLIEALQLTSPFQVFTEAVYEELFPATLSPTFSPTATMAEQLDPSANEEELMKDLHATNGGKPIPLIVGGVAGVSVLVSLVGMLLHQQRRKDYWKESNDAHKHPDLEASTTNDKRLDGKEDLLVEVASESGSSLLGRMLLASRILPPTMECNGTCTPPSSADGIDDMSDFDSTITMIEPQIVPVSKIIHDELNRQQEEPKKDFLTGNDEPSHTTYFPFWKNAIMPLQSASKDEPALGKRSKMLWSDVSSEPSDDGNKDFIPDDSWDFNDNDQDVDSDVLFDPFYPTGPNMDERNLLGEKMQTYRMERVKSRENLK